MEIWIVKLTCYLDDGLLFPIVITAIIIKT